MAKERQGERSEKLKVFEQRLFLKSAESRRRRKRAAQLTAANENKVSPRTQKQKEAHNPAKINKHKLAGQSEASAPSRLRGNYDISSIAVLVQHSSTHLPTGFREAWSSTTPTHASFYLCTDPEQPAVMLVVQPCARRNNPAVCRVHCALFGHPRPSYKPRSSTHLPTCFREAWSSTTPTHASFYLCTDPEQPAMMLVVQPCPRN